MFFKREHCGAYSSGIALLAALVLLLPVFKCNDKNYFLFIQNDSEFPVFIGPEIPIEPRPCYEVYNKTTIRLPSDIPQTGTFPLSSKKDSVTPITVDDALYFDGVSMTGGYGVSYTVPRPYIEAHAGKSIEVTWVDQGCAVDGASELWLLWIPDPATKILDND